MTHAIRAQGTPCAARSTRRTARCGGGAARGMSTALWASAQRPASAPTGPGRIAGQIGVQIVAESVFESWSNRWSNRPGRAAGATSARAQPVSPSAGPGHSSPSRDPAPPARARCAVRSTGSSRRCRPASPRAREASADWAALHDAFDANLMVKLSGSLLSETRSERLRTIGEDSVVERAHEYRKR